MVSLRIVIVPPREGIGYMLPNSLVSWNIVILGSGPYWLRISG